MSWADLALLGKRVVDRIFTSGQGGATLGGQAPCTWARLIRVLSPLLLWDGRAATVQSMDKHDLEGLPRAEEAGDSSAAPIGVLVYPCKAHMPFPVLMLLFVHKKSDVFCAGGDKVCGVTGMCSDRQ
jgi:hypothetical protein